MMKVNAPVLYTPADIQQIFKCSRKKSYQIFHMAGFPMFTIDTMLYVEKGALEDWIARQKRKHLTT